MSISAYSTLTRLGGWLISPLLKRGSPSHVWTQRLGYIPEEIRKNAPYDIWLHGVSVGEINVCKAVWDQLKVKEPDLKLIVSAFTETGFKRAQELFAGSAGIIYYPLDIPQAVNRAVSAISPKVYGVVETELWPNMLRCLHESRTKIVLLNGRISLSSFKKYQKISFLLKDVFQCFNKILAISESDAARLRMLGARDHLITICGNAKFEALLKAPSLSRAAEIQKKMGLPNSRPVIIAGSIRGREHEEVILALKELKNVKPPPLLILASRHIEKTPKIKDFLKKTGLSFLCLSKTKGQVNPDIDCLIIDKMGLLFDLYALCDIAFVGGSIEKKGGQNLMEPAAWQKPVIFGPHFHNFQEAGELLLKRNGGFTARDHKELASIFSTLLTKRDLLVQAGIQARKALQELGRDSARKQAKTLLEILKEAQ